MTQVTIHQAKTNLSKLIQQALQGEEVVIANRNQPVVKLQVIQPKKPKVRFGGLKHWKFKMGVGFDDPVLNKQIEDEFSRVYPNDPLAEGLPPGTKTWH
jgi:prevent-host-death family protein